MASKHRIITQKRIVRSANTSLLLKVFSTASVLGLFALAVIRMEPRYAHFALLPAGLFWLLDAYWVRREQLYQKLYVKMQAQSRQPRRTQWGFSFREEIAKLNAPHWIRFCWERSLLVFHGTVILSVVLVTVVTALKQI